MPTVKHSVAVIFASFFVFCETSSAEEKFEFEVIADSSDGLENPFGMGFDAEENFYIAEYLGGRLYKMAPGGKPEVIAGSGKNGCAFH